MVIERRQFLRGAGVSLAVPALASLASETAKAGNPPGEAKVSRFVCASPDYGMYPGAFFPTEGGRNYKMPAVLESLEPLRNQVTILSNVDHPNVGGGHGCSSTLLNGINVAYARGNRSRMLTLDQYIVDNAKAGTRFPSLHLGSGCKLSWTANGIPIPSTQSPDQIFSQLFVDDDAKTKTRRTASLDDNTSILDAVLENANYVQRNVGQQDRAKLDEYFTSIREVERKLSRQREWIGIKKPKAKMPSLGDDAETGYPYNLAIFYDLIVLALQTDSTRVVTLQMPGGNRMFNLPGVSIGYHSLTHHGKRPEMLEQLAIIDSFYVNEFARFLSRMRKVTDVEGRPMLDTTIAMFGSGMGNASSHSSRNLPIIAAGGGFRHGQHLVCKRQDDRNGMPLSNLYVSFLQQMGFETDAFASSQGNLNSELGVG